MVRRLHKGKPANRRITNQEDAMSIKEIIKTVTAKDVKKTGQAVKSFEGGSKTSNMIMIAFD